MARFKKGDRVVVVAEDHILRGYNCSERIVTGGYYYINYTSSHGDQSIQLDGCGGYVSKDFIRLADEYEDEDWV